MRFNLQKVRSHPKIADGVCCAAHRLC